MSGKNQGKSGNFEVDDKWQPCMEPSLQRKNRISKFFPKELTPSEKGTKMNILEVHAPR